MLLAQRRGWRRLSVSVVTVSCEGTEVGSIVRAEAEEVEGKGKERRVREGVKRGRKDYFDRRCEK